jgi:glycosyltransferase involved in cell wall biosynthesis
MSTHGASIKIKLNQSPNLKEGSGMAGDAAKQRLCIVAPTHWKALMAGSEYQISCLVERLILSNRYDIYYLTRRMNPNFTPRGYKIIQVAQGQGFRRFGEFFDARKLIRLLKAIRPDVMYQRVACGYTGIAAYYARQSDCKLVWHVAHEMEVQPFDRVLSKNMAFRYIDKKVAEYGIRHATNIIVQTRQQQEFLERYYGRKPSARIPNGHPLPKERVCKPDSVEIVWIANLKQWKQPELFINLARDLEELRDVRFTMIGGSLWSTERHSEFLRKTEARPNLTYLGARTQDEVNSILGRAHIFVNTSVQEGFPNTFIQAWMRQVPVVSLNVNPDDVLTENSIGFVSGTYEKMKQDLIYLIERPDHRRKMGQNAQAYAFKTYSMRNMEKIIQVIAA